MTYARRPARRAALRSSRRNTLQRDRRRVLFTEQLECRALLAADWLVSDYWNGTRPSDVNADGIVAPIDALLIVNDINQFGSRDVMGPAASPPPGGAEGENPISSGLSDRFFRDTNNDGKISPIDALIVFNELNGEGEATLMRYQIQLFAAGTNNPLPTQGGVPTISKGTDYDLVVTVKDDRVGGRGVFAGYLDVLYNPALTRPRVSEIQHVVLDNAAQPGTFRLTFNGQQTADIAFSDISNPNTIAADIQTKLAALSTIGSTGGVPNVEVTFDPISASGGQPAVANRWQVRFRGSLLDQNVSAISIAPGAVTPIPGLVAGPIVQTAQGVITDPIAFREAFRSRVIPGVNPIVSYVNALNAGNAADRIDDLGAIATGSSPFPGTFPTELVRARMTASDAGSILFAPDLTQIVTPAHDTLLYDRNTALATMEIMPGTSVTLNITEFINARPDAVSVNEDATTGANPGVTFNPITGVPPATGSDSDTTSPSPGALRVTAINGGGSPGGAITLPSGATVRFAGTAAVNVTGQNQIPANNIRYIPAPNFFGTDTFTYSVSNTVSTDVATVTVTVNGINDAPTLTGVSPKTIAEDAPLILSTGNGNAVSVNDIDAGTNNIQLTLTAGAGTLTLASTAGLTVTGNGTGSVQITGPQAAINTGINGLTYNPASNSTTATSIVFNVNDLGQQGSGGPLSATATMAITITPQNDPPINSVPAGTQSVDEGTVLTFSATNGNRISVTDADSANLTVQLTVLNGTLAAVPTTGVTITNITNGIQLVGPFGSLGSGPAGAGSTGINAALNGLTFTPSALFTGLTTLTMNSSDGTLSDQDTVEIDVVPTIRPRARPDSRTFPEATTPVVGSYRVDVLTNDAGNINFLPTLEEFPATVTGGTLQRFTNGTAALTDDQIDFIPTDPNFFGTVTFTYGIWDTSANPKPAPLPANAMATVTINITNTNDVPTAVNDDAVTDEDTPINIPVLNNDSDPDNNFGTPQDTLTAVVVGNPAHGTVVAGPGGTLRYSPTLNYNGPDSFTYQVNDGKGGLSNSATVSITVNPINDAPVAVNDTFSGANGPTEDGGTLNIPAPGVLGNDSDVDNPIATPNAGLTAVIQALPTHGTLTLNPDGSFSYQPTELNFAGTDTFTYRASDGLLQSNVATVSLVYNPVNDVPVAVDDLFYQTVEDTVLTVPSAFFAGILANDSDVETANSALRVGATFNLPTGLVMNPNNQGGFTYTPPLDFTGTVEFQYQVTDGNLLSNMATVRIQVTEFNDPPVANNDPGIVTPEDTSVDIDALANDTDPENFPLTLIQPGTAGTGTTAPAHGTVTIVGNQFRYTPASDFFGTDSFTYRAQDSGFIPSKQSNIATVSITVSSVNDLPVPVNDGVPNPILIVKDFGPQEVDGLTDNDTDPDNQDASASNDQVLRVDSVFGATNGTVTLQGSGTSAVAVFTPNPGYEGPAQFSYFVSDGVGVSATSATVFLTVVAFVPKDVGGIVFVDSGMSIGGNVVGANNGQFDFIDSNGNSQFDAGEASERTIRGVVMELTGTDFQGDPISLLRTTDIDGRYSFNDLTPPLGGTDYTVTQHQPDYLLDGSESPLDAQDSAANPLSALISDNGNDSFRLRWDITDQLGDITLRFGERGISAALVNAGGGDSRGLITDILASSSNKGFVLTTDLSGEFLWSWNLPGWENAAEISLQLDANLASATLTVKDRAGTTFVKRIHQDPTLNTAAEGYPAGANNPYGPRFRILGRSGVNDYLIRIDGGAADFGLNLQSLAANSAGGEGEGEGNVDPNFARAADEVFSGESWA